MYRVVDPFSGLAAVMWDSDRLTEIAALLVYLGVLLAIGLRSARQIKTSVDYTLAGRDVPWVIVLATTAATMVGGGASIGSVAKVYHIGLAAAFVTCAWHLQLIFTGLWLAPRLRDMKLVTVADYFDAKFGELARRLAVVCCLLFMVGALVAQFAAMGTITESVLAVDYRMAVLIGGTIVVFYSTIGGIGAVVKTDVLQFLILVSGIGVAAGYLVHHQGGLANMAAVASRVDSEAFFADMLDLFGPESRVRIITLFCAFFLGELLVPTYAVRCFIARDARSARWGVAGAGIFLLLFMPMATYVMGVAARADPAVKSQVTRGFQSQVARAQSNIDQNSSAEQNRATRRQAAAEAAQIAFPALIRSAFHPLFSGIMIAAVIAAVMSSADSCLSCLGTIVMEDIYRPHIKPQATDAQMLRVAQWTTLISGILTATCACVYRDIVGILEFVYDFWAPTMVIPFLYGIFCYQRHQVPAVVASMLTGLSSTIIWKWGCGSPGGFSPALFGFLTALGTVCLLLPCSRYLSSLPWLQPPIPSEAKSHLHRDTDA